VARFMQTVYLVAGSPPIWTDLRQQLAENSNGIFWVKTEITNRFPIHMRPTKAHLRSELGHLMENSCVSQIESHPT